jgi:DNA mismatch repair protein MutL
VPAQFTDEDEAALLKSLIEQYRLNENTQKLDKKEAVARTLAKRNAQKMGRSLNNSEISGLINQLFETAMPSVSPEGKTIMSILTLDKLATLLIN